MYPCRADSSTTAHVATAAAAAAVMESSGYSYGGYSFNNSPSSQGLFTSFPSSVLNQRLAAAVGLAACVSGGGDSDHRGGVNQMDPQFTCLKLGKRQHLEKSYAVKPYSGGSDDLGASAAKCQVDGCQAALVRAKEYHRRHKVCEVHAKAAVVVVVGVNQRFCQQCSRFHLVSEFDESKRSCRSRLAGHNKRRRKNSNVSHGSIAAASTWRAPSLLSSTTNTNALPSDLSSRSSAALRELIDEHRATTFLAGSHHIQRQVTLDLMQQGPRLVTKARDEEPCFGLWNSFL